MNLIRGHSELLRRIRKSRVQDLPDRYRMIYRTCTFLNENRGSRGRNPEKHDEEKNKKEKNIQCKLKNKSMCDHLSTH